MSSKNSSRSSARSTRRKSKACSFRIRAVLHGGTAFFAFIQHRKFSRQLSRLFPRAVLPALFPACFLGDPLDGLLRNFPAVLWAVFPSVFPLTVLPALFPVSSSSTLSRYSSCYFFPKHFPDLFPRLTFFLFISSGFFFRWFVFLSASFSAYPFCIFLYRPARPLFCNLAHLTLLAPSLAHSAIFPAILPVVFSCAASAPPYPFPVILPRLLARSLFMPVPCCICFLPSAISRLPSIPGSCLPSSPNDFPSRSSPLPAVQSKLKSNTPVYESLFIVVFYFPIFAFL